MVSIVTAAILAFIIVAGVIISRDRSGERPGTPSPHALDQSQWDRGGQRYGSHPNPWNVPAEELAVKSKSKPHLSPLPWT